MDIRMFIPIYGPFMEMKRIHDSDEDFSTKAFDAAMVGGILGTETIFALSHASHMASIGQGSALSAMAVNRAMGLISKGPVVATALVASGLYGKATAPGADVRYGPYGSVRITPRLLGGYY